MPYSLESYLERRTTEELLTLLHFCFQAENQKDYADIVSIIQYILSQRKSAE